MSPFVATLNFSLALGTMVAQLLAVGLLILYFSKNRPLKNAVSAYALPTAFLMVLGASGLSLFYSEALGFAPCGLCWIQRVFLYPQVILLGIALFKKDSGIAIYSIALSIAGALNALYQHYLQMGGTDILPCPAVTDAAADCTRRILFEFGYITFPLMSFTVFAFLIVLMLYVRKRAD